MNFIRSQNNGTTALIREDQAKTYGAIKVAGGKPELVVRVFTFVPSGSSMLEFATGTTEDMEQLLSLGGHKTIPMSQARDYGWDGNVPFSNGYDIAQRELDFKTTLADVLSLFLADAQPPHSGDTLRG